MRATLSDRAGGIPILKALLFVADRPDVAYSGIVVSNQDSSTLLIYQSQRTTGGYHYRRRRIRKGGTGAENNPQRSVGGQPTGGWYNTFNLQQRRKHDLYAPLVKKLQ